MKNSEVEICQSTSWLVYILPNRQGMSLWAQGGWVLRPPLWVAFLHGMGWFLIWGPLAHTYGLYEGMSLSEGLMCLGLLAVVYYVQVWQDIVGQIRQTQHLKAQRRRFARRTQRV